MALVDFVRDYRVSQHQKGKTTKVNVPIWIYWSKREWQWHQLGHMQICTSPQTHNDASIPPLSFLQAGCPSGHPTGSVKALKAVLLPKSVLLPVINNCTLHFSFCWYWNLVSYTIYTLHAEWANKNCVLLQHWHTNATNQDNMK